MAKEYNTLGWMRFAFGVLTFAIVMAVAAAGSFIKTQSRMAVIETENNHLKESLVRIEDKVNEIDKFLRDQVK